MTLDNGGRKTPQQLRDEQRRNTREPQSLKVIENTNRTIKSANDAALVAVGPGLNPFVRLVETAAREKDREIVRLRRALVATQVRLERTTASILPRLRSKAKEVRELRKKLNPENTKGSRVTGARARKLGVTLKSTTKKTDIDMRLPPIDMIERANGLQPLVSREKIKG